MCLSIVRVSNFGERVGIHVGLYLRNDSLKHSGCIFVNIEFYMSKYSKNGGKLILVNKT